MNSMSLNSFTDLLKSPFGKLGIELYLPVKIPCLIGEKKHTPKLFFVI